MIGAQPFVCRRFHIGCGRFRHRFELIQIKFGRAAISHAFGKHVGTSAETAQAFDAARKIRQVAVFHARQFFVGHAFVQEFVGDKINFALDFRWINAGFNGCDNGKTSGEFAARSVGAHVGCEFFLVNQTAVETRAF